MKLTFVTQNKHKVEEAQAILREYGIHVQQRNAHYLEDKELSIQETARQAAKRCAEQYNESVFVDDTGMFFTSYNDFPGANAKLMFNALGYDGLLTLLTGKKREAYFICCIAFCRPGHEPRVFEGRLDGHITTAPNNLDKDVMPYERIFVPKRHTQTLSSMSREEKNRISHRANALHQLGEYLTGRRHTTQHD